MDQPDLDLRNLTYRMFVELGRAPTADEVAGTSGLSQNAVLAGWRRLDDAHALVLNPATAEIRTVVTGFSLTSTNADVNRPLSLESIDFFSLFPTVANRVDLLKRIRSARGNDRGRHSPQGESMIATHETTSTTPTLLLDVENERYAYRRFGARDTAALPLLCLQHFTGTLDNWDPAVTDRLASDREVILFDNAGIGRSTGTVPQTVAGMATHTFKFLDRLGIDRCDVLGFSLGGMIAQQMALERPSVFRRMILVGTAPRGGEDIMRLEKPKLAQYLNDPTLQGYAVLQKIFFTLTAASQAAGQAFIGRLLLRTKDRDRISGPDVAGAQMAAFREWEQSTGERFADLHRIAQPTLVINGVHDEMIPVRNSYWLAEHLPNAVLLVYPDAGHGSLFQWHDSFANHVSQFLASDSQLAPY